MDHNPEKYLTEWKALLQDPKLESDTSGTHFFMQMEKLIDDARWQDTDMSTVITLAAVALDDLHKARNPNSMEMARVLHLMIQETNDIDKQHSYMTLVCKNIPHARGWFFYDFCPHWKHVADNYSEE